MWSTAKWRTAIPANYKDAAGGDADVKEHITDAGTGRFFAVVGVVGLAVALAVLPALTAFGVATAAIERLAEGGASLVAGLGGVQLAAVILGVLAFVGSNPRRRDSAVSGD